MRVLKFGGTSVADAAAIARVVSIVRSRQGARTVVVSALAGTTDALLAIADGAVIDGGAALAALDALTARHRVVAGAMRGDYARRVLDPAIEGIARGAAGAVRAITAGGASPALVDRLVACGELWSSRLVAAAFVDAGVPAQWFDARHLVRTDGRHGEATPDLPATDKAVTRLLRPALALDNVAVLGGFIGCGPDGATTTLGRGGSDYSAAILGACLLADEIEIWTDVDGVLTADPRVVPGARVMPALSYEDAETLATFGAKVLHPKTIEPAASRDIPVRVLNTQRPGEPGTRIHAAAAASGSYTAVASRAGLCLLDVTPHRRPAPDGFAARALQALADAGVAVVLGEVHRDRLIVAVDGSCDVEALRARISPLAQVQARHGLSAVCVVGEQLASDPGAVAAALARVLEPVHLLARPGGATGFAVVVDDGHAHTIVARLHEWLIAEPLEVREGVAS